MLFRSIMFRPSNDAPAASDRVLYTPGVYSAALKLGAQEVNVEVAVDTSQITSVTMVPLSDSVATMYPLVQPSFQNLADQICTLQTVENLSYPEESRYTSQVLIQAIKRALDKAAVD